MNNIAHDILFKSVDENIFSRVKISLTAKEVWNELIRIGEGDDQAKDNKLTVAMNKFEDFKQLQNEMIANMHDDFLKSLKKSKAWEKRSLRKRYVSRF